MGVGVIGGGIGLRVGVGSGVVEDMGAGVGGGMEVELGVRVGVRGEKLRISGEVTEVLKVKHDEVEQERQ